MIEQNLFAIRLKEIRQIKNLSQLKLANAIGYEQSCISQWESGTREPSFNDLIFIAQFFNVTTDYLLGLTDF